MFTGLQYETFKVKTKPMHQLYFFIIGPVSGNLKVAIIDLLYGV